MLALSLLIPACAGMSGRRVNSIGMRAPGGNHRHRHARGCDSGGWSWRRLLDRRAAVAVGRGDEAPRHVVAEERERGTRSALMLFFATSFVLPLALFLRPLIYQQKLGMFFQRSYQMDSTRMPT
jgi:hypothetical protein